VLGGIFIMPSEAAVYFIDYQNGDDNNSGVSQITSWQHAPGMPGFSAAYSHQAGDKFVFRGGVTWPAAALPLAIQFSGEENTVDEYTVDFTWHAGSAWTQPVLDMEQTAKQGVVVGSQDNLVVDNIKIINPADQNFPSENMLVIGKGAQNIIVRNCTLDAAGGAGDAGPIVLRDVDGVVLDNNYIRGIKDDGNPDGILITPWTRMKNITIKNNVISMINHGDGIHIDVHNDDDSSTPRFMDNYGPILIENNSFYDVQMGRKMAIILIGGAKDLTIRYNKFYGDFTESGIGVRFGGEAGTRRANTLSEITQYIISGYICRIIAKTRDGGQASLTRKIGVIK